MNSLLAERVARLIVAQVQQQLRLRTHDPIASSSPSWWADILIQRALGGPGSGFHGHAGRPGEVGGSTSGSGADKFVKPTKKPGENIESSIYVTEPTRQQIDHVLGEGVDPHQVAANMVADSDEKFRVIVRRGGVHNQDAIHIRFVSEAGTTIERVFRRDAYGQLTVDHDYFELAKQNVGGAKDILRSSFAEYERLGVVAVHMEANIDVGGYAWARYGFVPINPGHILGKVANELEDSNPYKGSTADRLLKATNRELNKDRPDGHFLWKIADTEAIGKQVLLGSSWSGKFDMKDTAAIARFNHYVNPKSATSKAPIAKRPRPRTFNPIPGRSRG